MKGPLPLVIGVTGHRDIRPEDVPRLEGLVTDVIRDLQRRAPNTQIEMLSPLAEGADMLCARVALREGVRLVVPLPMPKEVYLEDFQGNEARSEFESLLSSADRTFELPIREGRGPEDIRQRGEDRDWQYGQLGAWIVQNSHTLVALWDGVISHLPHGTGDVVTFNLEGIPREFAGRGNLLDLPESAPVYHIVTPRSGSHPEGSEVLTCNLIYPPHYADRNEAARKYYAILDHTDRFNADAVKTADRLSEGREQSAKYLIGDPAAVAEDSDLRETMELFAVADSMALHYSRRTRSMIVTLFLLVTGAAIIFDIFTHVYYYTWALLAGYLVLLTVTYLLVLRSERGAFHDRHLDYRALAEGLRVRFFWMLGRLDHEIADHYLHKQRSELDWIRYALRVWKPLSKVSRPKAEDHVDADRFTLVTRHWVEDQFKYFSKAATREEHAVERAEKIASWMVIVGIALAFFHVVWQALISPDPIKWLLVAIALAPILAGLLIGYIEKRAHGDHARQYERMAVLFQRALVQIEESRDKRRPQDVKQVMFELGKEALAENGDWVLVHRDRPIEVPKG